jgi:RNA polymerase sigma factor (sigma-70 family)
MFCIRIAGFLPKTFLCGFEMDRLYNGQKDMNPDDQTLLRRYLQENSEEAFTELLRRHKDLIYSAALRQSDYDYDLAEEITQAVFIDFARKAPQLLGHSSIAGWFFKSTRYAAANARRGAHRRRVRDHQFYAMNPSSDEPHSQPEWEEIAPVLDEAMASLKSQDQTAILLRFFQGLPLAQVGAHLGINENAARMRVDRALEKLHRLLQRKGVTAAGGVLAACIKAHAVQKFPEELFPVFLGKALAAGAPSTPAGLALLNSLLQPTALKIAGGLGAALLLLTGLWWFHDPDGEADLIPRQNEVLPAASPQEAISDPVVFGAGPGALEVQPRHLLLTVLAAETGQPLPEVQIAVREWENDRMSSKTWITDAQGLCYVPFSPETARLEITTQFEGLADTMLHWRPEHGEIIPEEYILRLKPAVLIGGIVVDEEGYPVPEAKIGFNHEDNPEQDRFAETHQFGFIEKTTGADGRWQIHRIAASMLPRLYGRATHSDYISSQSVFLRRVPSIEEELLRQEHQFVLNRAVTVHGIVLNPHGNPVPDAKLLAGILGDVNQREAHSQPDGGFSIGAVSPGPNLLSVDAGGFAPKTVKVDFQESDFFEIRLEFGEPLSLRVVNQDAEPIAGAYVWLSKLPISDNSPRPLQFPLNGRTDEQGRFVWTNAPAGEHLFAILAKGYMRRFEVPLSPSPAEHQISLLPALTIHGQIEDRLTGKPIPKFRIIAGTVQFRPAEGNYLTNWTSLERFWLNFSDGQFRYSFEEPTSIGSDKFIFKIEADSYLPHITRIVDAREGEARLDAALTRANERLLIILGPDSRPAAGAQVGLASRRDRPEISNGRLDPQLILAGGLPRPADEHGVFRFSADDLVDRIVVTHPEGFADLLVKDAALNPLLVLEPWGTLRVQLTEAKPAQTRFRLVSERLSLNKDTYSAAPDANGVVLINKVPPGRHRLIEQFHFHRNSWRELSANAIDVAPGENDPIEY